MLREPIMIIQTEEVIERAVIVNEEEGGINKRALAVEGDLLRMGWIGRA